MFKFLFTNWEEMRNDPLAKLRFVNSIWKTIAICLIWGFSITQAFSYGQAEQNKVLHSLVEREVSEKIATVNLRLAALEAQMDITNKKLERVIIKPEFGGGK